MTKKTTLIGKCNNIKKKIYKKVYKIRKSCFVCDESFIADNGNQQYCDKCLKRGGRKYVRRIKKK